MLDAHIEQGYTRYCVLISFCRPVPAPPPPPQAGGALSTPPPPPCIMAVGGDFAGVAARGSG